MKQHLAGVKGQVESCKKVSYDVRFRMKEALNNIIQVRKDNQDAYEDNNPYDPSMSQFKGDLEEDANEVEEIPQNRMSNRVISISEGGSTGRKKTKGNMQGNGKGKTKVEGLGIDAYFAPRTTPGSQPSIKSVLATKEIISYDHEMKGKDKRRCFFIALQYVDLMDDCVNGKKLCRGCVNGCYV
ncbi:hypothetical protein HHK36_017116 [Tetracentron sinense]|uniref:Uncharacterized protein n=1 Tax=Tetracentron sinense TaxID=13715 RepID=A0A834Z2K7_TETSI|nr:hypothetical protein HHK36_017116 [Tetracentron sinense]